MSEKQTNETQYVCFRLPPEFRDGSVADAQNPTDEAESADQKVWQMPGDELWRGFSTRGLEVMSRFLPTLMCGEESATHVFQQEGERIKEIPIISASSALMAQIAREEAFHERLIGLFRSQLPLPDDLSELRRRARFFFLRLASRDPAIHFARIIGLDSGVCITLSSLLQESPDFARAPLAYRCCDRIRRDEARHVRTSRRHVLDLGIDQATLVEESANARKGLAELLQMLADDFEDFGVDPDKLFRRITGPDEF